MKKGVLQVLIITIGLFAILAISYFFLLGLYRPYPGHFSVKDENAMLMKKWGFYHFDNYFRTRIDGYTWRKNSGDTAIFISVYKDEVVKDVLIKMTDSLSVVELGQKLNADSITYTGFIFKRNGVQYQSGRLFGQDNILIVGSWKN